MLTKVDEISQISVDSNNVVSVRTSMKILENGEMIGNEVYHRHCIAPGNDYSQEDIKVRAICASLHTPEVIAAYKAKQIV